MAYFCANFRGVISTTTAFVLLLALVSCPVSSHADTAYIVKMKFKDQRLNLRVGPSLNKSVFNLLRDGRCVMATETIKRKNDNDWILLSNPKGWVSFEYLEKSSDCADIYKILDNIYSRVEKDCIKSFSDNEIQENNHNKNADKYLFSLLNEKVKLDGWCDDIIYKGVHGRNNKDVMDLVSDLAVSYCGDSVYDWGKLCIQGRFPCYSSESANCRDELPKCDTPHEVFLSKRTITHTDKGYEVYIGGFDCCGGISHFFEKIDGKWKITQIRIACD